MDARVYSVKANSQAGNIRIYIMTTKKTKATRYSARDLENLCILLENSEGGHTSRREHWVMYCR